MGSDGQDEKTIEKGQSSYRRCKKVQSVTFLKVLRQFLGTATRHLDLSALKEMLYG